MNEYFVSNTELNIEWNHFWVQLSTPRLEGALQMIQTGGWVGINKMIFGLKMRKSIADNSNRWGGGKQLHQTEKQKQEWQCR